jgi:RNA polymerase sigma-70 factor, ECF subfamily
MALSSAALIPLRSVTPAQSGISDADLVLRAQSGERWAEGAIYQRYSSMIANLAARLVGDRADAMDVTQDVFIDLLSKLGSLRDPSALKAWLVRCTVRRAHRVFRRRKLRRLLGLDRTLDDMTLDALASPETSAETRVELARVSAVLASLPVRQRIAWLLRHVEGETLPAVAHAIETSLATAKRDIAEAERAIDLHLEERT